MKINELIKNIQKKKILVVGDIMLDNYYFGSSTRISPEAPVPILLENKNTKVLGGAANVALNLISAYQEVSIMTVVGDDSNGTCMINMLKEKKINTSLIIRDANRCTTVKNRYIGQNNMQMFRFDQENNIPINEEISNKLIELYEKNIKNFDLVIMSDYNKGLLNVNNTPKIIEIANKNDKKVIVDIKEPKYKKYYGAYLIKPNLKELSEITGMKINNTSDIEKASMELKKNTNCKYVLTTRGADGMSLLLEDNKIINIDCASREVYDVTGAGDTVISYLSVGIANNYDLIDSVNISNYAAGVKVSKMGTYAVTPEDIMDYVIDSNNVLDENKIISASNLAKKLENNTKKIVFTNGCFDIFHVGHLRYLKESSKYGDILVVGVNSDASIKRLKGDKRPIVPQNDRMELLSSLSFVTYVVPFDEDTPYKIIKKIRPDIITKGGDYNPNDVVGKDIVEEKGGKVIICPLIEHKSTTNIIDKILEAYNE